MSYLNYNSTAAPVNHMLNVSDIGYRQVQETRSYVGLFIRKVKQFINAPIDSEVIINSGSTECIANSVIWAKAYNSHGSICGSDLDHTAVEDNCKNYGMQYEQVTNSIPKRCAMLFITHVSGKTGEIYDLDTYKKMMQTCTFLSSCDATNEDNLQTSDKQEIRQYKPLVVMDATQSINKIKIDMQALRLDGLFFSLHKIGGPTGYGVFVINNRAVHKFVPLIAGSQQGRMRGGTLNMVSIIGAQQYLKITANNLVDTWTNAVKILREHNVNVIEPKRKHLYNTILIKLDTCPLGIISKLSNENIYIGGISACANENVTHNTHEGYLRISFTSPKQISDILIERIAEVIDEEKNEHMSGGDNVDIDDIPYEKGTFESDFLHSVNDEELKVLMKEASINKDDNEEEDSVINEYSFV